MDVNRLTLGRLERGDLTVSLALLVRVLNVLGLASDLENIAKMTFWVDGCRTSHYVDLWSDTARKPDGTRLR